MPKIKKLHPVTRYATDIVKGKIIANKWVKLACKRHLKDLKRRDIYFDEIAADHIIDFFEEFLVFYEGEFDGKSFILTPHQKFIVGSIFGWKRKDGLRRFRTAYIEEAKGNGKSPLAGGIGLYGLTFDDEPGGEIYSAATTRDQAGILFRDARLYAEGSESLKEMLVIDRHNIANLESNSFFRPVSSEHKGLDGKKPHMALIDEIHEHPNDLVVRKMSAGTKTRRQALIFEITNAGYDRHSICYQHHEHTAKILEGIIKDDAWFGLMSGLDVCDKCEAKGKTIPQDGCPDCDDWRNPKVWCLAGDTSIYAKINRGITVTSLQSLCEHYTQDQIELWDGRHWVKMLGYSKSSRTVGGDYRIELRSGQKVGCTAHHQWPTLRGKVRTDELQIGDIISQTILPLPDVILPIGIKNFIGWLVGLYLAEGTESHDKNGGHYRIQLHGHENEMQRWEYKIKPMVESFGGTIHSHKYKNRGILVIESSVILSIIKLYIGGNKAVNKYLKPATWRQSNEFLQEMISGYLEGDGCYDRPNDRYRLGFARNYRLADGFRTLAARLNAKIRIANGNSTCEGKNYLTHKGEWRWRTSTHKNAKNSGEVIKIGKSKARNFFHIGVDNDDGLFALASGTLTYNSKANPNLKYLGKPFTTYLKRQVSEAKAMPSQENIVKRLNFCIWAQSITKWISVDKWNACDFPVDPEALKGRSCYGGLDLSSNIDLTAWLKVFPPEEEDGLHEILCRFFLPEDNMAERVKRDKVPYDVWARQGFITLTPGNTIDYTFIIAQIQKDMTDYHIRELAFDRWGSQKITGDLQDLGFEIEGKRSLIQFGQGFASMSPPTKEVETMVLKGNLAHGGNPVLAWNVSNVAIKTDAAGNVKPDKEKSIERIDGAVAMIMGVGRAMLRGGLLKSVYEDHGILIF